MKALVTITFETSGNTSYWTIERLVRYYRKHFVNWAGGIDNNYQKLRVEVKEIE